MAKVFFRNYIFWGLFISTTFAFGIRERRDASTCLTNGNFSLVRAPGKKLLDPNKVKESYQKMNFALKGPLYIRTVEINEELKQGTKKAFTELIRANIVDSQGSGQKPMTFLRQLLSLISYPEQSSNFPSDVVQRMKEILSDTKGKTIGSTTGERGLDIVRRKVAEFITKRDSVVANYKDIYLTNGVSGGLELAFKLIQQEECNDFDVGVMTPNPLYPLFATLITQHHMTMISYNLNPERDWALEVNELERAYKNASCSCNCKPRVLVIINPGNPTGKILRRNNMEEIVKFAFTHNLILFADEIYQYNVFGDVPFISMHKVAKEMGAPYEAMEIISFFSISKGYTSEAGLRGGYMHMVNMDKGVDAIMFKLVALNMCPNVMGQVGLYSLVHPPQIGEPSYQLYNNEITEYIQDHRALAKAITSNLNKIKGFNCSVIEGGSVAFTKFEVPEKAVKVAEAEGKHPDVFYSFELLESVGLSVAAGTSFGLSPTQHYMRISLPVSVENTDKLLTRLKAFHDQFLIKYS